MREGTQPADENICAICKQPIPEHQICKGLPNGKKAHITCYLDHGDDEELELGR